jgi:hypothetical protein
MNYPLNLTTILPLPFRRGEGRGAVPLNYAHKVQNTAFLTRLWK